MTYASHAKQISRIDRDIDAIQRDLCGRERFDELSAAGWQAAWDRHPELHAREQTLFHERGSVQLARDLAEHAAAMRPRREPRPKKCPTCGCRTLAA